jgi:cellulose synthase/poly-beta-1,6-N-acetylglucosamine synthase-like glycosyltransferase
VPAENLALEHATGEYILLVDDDAVVPRDWVVQHLAHYREPSVGAVGGPAVNHQNGQPLPINGRTPVGRITWLGRFIGNMHDQPPEWRSRPAFEADHLVGYNMSLRRCAFERFEDGLRRYWQMFEADVCLQVRARGYRVLFDPGIVVDHYLTPRVSVYEGGRGGDVEQKVGNAAYNAAFILSKHTRGPQRWARWAFQMAVGTTQAPGPLLLPLTIARHGQPLRELAIARLALARRLAGWRAGRRTRTGS